MLNDLDKQLEVIDPEEAEKLNFIIDLIGARITRRVIVREFLKKYGGCNGTAYNFYKRAVVEIQEELKKAREEHIAQSLATSNLIIKKSIANGDTAAATAALKYHDAVIALTPSFNEMGTPTPNVQGPVKAIDDDSARTLASFIARAESTVGEDKPPALGQEQSPKD